MNKSDLPLNKKTPKRCMIYSLCFSTVSNRTVTKPCTLKVNLPLSFSSMSNRTVTKLERFLLLPQCCFSSMSNRTVTKPRHGPAPDLLAVASS